MRKLVALAAIVVAVVSSDAFGAGETGRVTCGRIFYSAISYCAGLPGGTAAVTNESFSVINVTRVYGSTAMSIAPANAATISDYAANAAAPPRCYASTCELSPGRTLTAQDTQRSPDLVFSFNLDRTL